MGPRKLFSCKERRARIACSPLLLYAGLTVSQCTLSWSFSFILRGEEPAPRTINSHPLSSAAPHSITGKKLALGCGRVLHLTNLPLQLSRPLPLAPEPPTPLHESPFLERVQWRPRLSPAAVPPEDQPWQLCRPLQALPGPQRSGLAIAAGRGSTSAVSLCSPRSQERRAEPDSSADEILPCTSCRESNAVCMLTSIPQKRGPRPRYASARLRSPGSALTLFSPSLSTSTPDSPTLPPHHHRERPGNTQLEQRLAQLEQLLASIPHGASGNGLSEDERKEIRRAAEGGSGFESAATPVDEESAAGSGYEQVRKQSLDSVGHAGVGGLEEEGMQQQGVQGYEFEYGGAFPTVPAAYILSNPYGGSHSPQPSPQHSTIGLPAATSSRRNLIYRSVPFSSIVAGFAADALWCNSDKEGELKFVGPSRFVPSLPTPSCPLTPSRSGLPLLGLLKELKDNDVPDSDFSRMDPSSVDQKPTLQERERVERGPATGAASVGNGLWATVAEIMSAELMDELVRGYFNVSHLREPLARRFAQTTSLTISRNSSMADPPHAYLPADLPPPEPHPPARLCRPSPLHVLPLLALPRRPTYPRSSRKARNRWTRALRAGEDDLARGNRGEDHVTRRAGYVQFGRVCGGINEAVDVVGAAERSGYVSAFRCRLGEAELML